MTDEKLADAAAIEAVRNGDRQRYRELVERHANQVFAVAWCRLGDHALAEDAAQEAFIRGFQRLDLLGQTEKFGTWITAIARNSAINLGLRHRNELKNRRRWILEKASNVDRHGDEGRDDSDERGPTAEGVREALAKLPAIHRECLALFYLEGKSVAEASAVLGLSESTFKTRLHRARGALRSLLETRFEESLESLRPSGKLVGAVMFALPAQKPAWPFVGAIAGAVAKLLPFKVALVALQVGSMSSALLLHRWLGRKEGANFRDPRGFRAENQRRHLRRTTIFLAAYLAINTVIPLLITNRALAMPSWNLRVLSRVAAILLLVAIVIPGRQCVLVRNRFQIGTVASLLWLVASLVVMGLPGWDFAWGIAGLALCVLTQSLVFADRPMRMDESLFLRAANGLLKQDNPDSEADPAGAATAEERFRFARFLGQRFLVIDWRSEPDALRLRVANVTPSARLPLYPFVWRDASTLTLQADRRVTAHLGNDDRRSLEGLHCGRTAEAQELEDNVSGSVRRAWAAFARGEAGAAEAAIGQEAVEAVFLKDPTRAAATRWNVWMLRVGVVLMAAHGLILARGFPPPRPVEPARPGKDLSAQEIRERLGRIVARSAKATEWSHSLEGEWGLSMILPSREWFTPATLSTIDEEIRRARQSLIVAIPVEPSLIDDEPYARTVAKVNAHIANPNRVALRDPFFQLALSSNLIRPEDLGRFGVSREGVRDAISSLSDEDRRALASLDKSQTLRPDEYTAAHLDQLWRRLRFLETMDCLDLLDLSQPVAGLRALQVVDGNPPTGMGPRERKAKDGLFSLTRLSGDNEADNGGFNLRNQFSLPDTYQALTVLRIVGALDQIDREACIRGILRLHRERNLRPGRFLTNDAKWSYCSYESLRMLNALDRVKDWPDWQRWLDAGERMYGEDGIPRWRPIEAWFYRRQFESNLSGRRGP